MAHSQKGWTEEEVQRLKDAWKARVPHSQLEELFPGRTKLAVVRMASRLGLKRGSDDETYVPLNERWTEKEIQRLKDAWKARVPHSQLEDLFPGRTKAAVFEMASRLGLKRGSDDETYVPLNERWTEKEIQRLKDAWKARVPHSQLENLFPGRTKASVVGMAVRLGLKRGRDGDQYVSMHELMRISKMSHPTLTSIIEYSNLYDQGVRTEGSPPRVVYNLRDAEHAILRWIDLMSLLQYAEYIERPYGTLTYWMKRRGIEFQPNVKLGHRRLHPVEWARLFDGDVSGLEFMFKVTSEEE
jgi:hypothetical protein